MAPSAQRTMVNPPEVKDDGSAPKPLTGEEVVISGMSGIFPKSDSVLEFKNNLFNKVDMVTQEDSRWVFNHPEIPKHLGKVKGMGKFDAQFFRVHYKQACTMEPMSRKLLEHAYSAIYDAGINPVQLYGKKVGVFIGAAFSESEKMIIYENIQRNGFGITGGNKAMYANRISYWIDGKGPSYALDAACASSMSCLEHAYRCMSTGQCEAAIVGGCNLCAHPNVTLNCKRAGFLCLDGKTKCFDKNGDGYVRSDAVSVLFLQKSKNAKRIYSEVYYAKTNYGTNVNADEFLPIREPKEIQEFLEAFYSEIDVCPKDVEYIEASGAAIAEADGKELEAIGKVFANDKTIKVGCVKSNMGSSEAASGVCAVTKVCLAYHEGKLPANLHYSEPQDQIDSVRDGRVQVLTDNSPFKRGFSALNMFSFGGVNLHVLLKGHFKPKDLQRYKSSIPHLVLASGRQNNCVEKIFESLKNRPVDAEQIALIHDIHDYEIAGHMCRGYILLENNENNETVCLSESIEYCPGITRPVWFVYSGMGSQWAGMGAELMRIPVFAAAIEKCHKVLAPKGIDIVRILCEPDKTIFDNILHSFVGIAAVQIGLTDVLREIGIVPDHIIGHSVGELGCAYADGCFTAEEMILSAYSRGLVSVQTPFIRGSMAAVGLGYKNILPLCPPEIEVACHNSSDSSTISGPAEPMKKFISELTSKGIFAKEVPCSNISFHSRYIADGGPGLLKYLSDVIKDPKPRSEKWVSTSVPQENWDDPKAKFSSAEYHTNNLLNPVLFEETSKLIPSDALVIEIAPHGLLQAILKRSMPECQHLPLTRRGHVDPVKFLLEGIGKLYELGLNPKISALYPKIEYPVSTETPLLSHLVEWEHSETWPQAIYNTKHRVTAPCYEFVMSIHDDDFKYFRGHNREGICVLPEAAFLVNVWQTLAMYNGKNYKDMSVVFKDLKFRGEVAIRDEDTLKFSFMIHKGNARFGVSYENTEIVSGFVKEAVTEDFADRNPPQSDDTDDIALDSKDVYTLMNLRGYSYSDAFQSIHSTTSSRKKGIIKWSEDWISFLDGLIQLNAFAKDHDGVSVPTIIRKLSINVEEHKNAKMIALDNVNCINAEIYDHYNYTKCGGVELVGLTFNDKPAVEKEPDVMQSRVFVPYFVTGVVDLKTALQVSFGTISDNVNGEEVNVIECLRSEDHEISKLIKEVTRTHASANFDVVSVESLDLKAVSGADVLITVNLLGNEMEMKKIHDSLRQNSFILSMEEDISNINPDHSLFTTVSAMSVQNHILVLLRKTSEDIDVTFMPINHDINFTWVSRLRNEIEKSRKVVLISERQPYCGLYGLVKKLSKQPRNNVSLVLVDDFYHVPSFNAEHLLFKEQLRKNLTFNVLKKGVWGSFYYLSNDSYSNFQNVYLTNAITGDLNSLTWIEASSTPANNNLIQVCYSSPSYRDAQDAAGTTSKSNRSFGMDYSGINSLGERVMGVVQGGALSTLVEADPDLTWPVPEHWTLEDAATVPLPYLQAYYCLAIKSELLRKRKVFINGGAGALGQAVISICLALDCEVFTTVSDTKKKEFLMKLFPSLPESNIASSHNIHFKDRVMQNTKNKGCDVVINYMNGNLREAVIKCVGKYSLFLDLSEHDMIRNNDFHMSFLFTSGSYASTQFSSIFKTEGLSEKKLLHKFISEGIASGVVRPLSRMVYSPANVSRAFRLLASSKHRGKVLIKMRDSNTNHDLKVHPRLTCTSRGSYIVVCDESALSLELIDRLVKRGARNLFIHIKPNSIAGYCFTKIFKWKKLNVTIKISSENLQTENGCTNMIREATKTGPVCGIFIVQNYSSDAQEDQFRANVVTDKFKNVACVVANLDLVSRNICNELNHFVIINYGPKSYADEYVGSVIDKICQSRNEITLPALVFRIGTIAELDRNLDNLQTKIKAQTLSTALNGLESSLKMKNSNTVAYNLKKRSDLSFIERISRIIGVENINEIKGTHTLQDITNDVAIQQIITAIREEYNILYPDEQVKKMTIASIKDFESRMVKANNNFNGGLGAFYTFIDEDECYATEPVIPMRTKFSIVKEEEELDPKATYLFLVPGFEGHNRIFTSICERLKVQAMTLQLGPDVMDDTIPQMAYNIRKFMKKRFELKSKFYLLGYSFGVNVALELAALLEKEGHVGVVYCLDSSPDAMRAQLDAYIGNLKDSELQDRIVEHMYKLMAGTDSEELKEELRKTEDWPDKVEACINRLKGVVHYSHQYKRSILQGAYRRILLAREYEPNFQLESELVLMKGIPHPSMGYLTNDYNLFKYSKRPVQVFKLESDHALAPQDCRASNIINKLLDPAVLEEFNKSNLCESYLADPTNIL
ncbi:fatty acid synthase-like [Bombyx mandarina]|uniref:Fatty acid synthase-like n=1 Tax=Bombyx mandarina TaxID=7092 RepID=A0A6J2JHH5_BOMMA|nr:fatty acid synthase-like [Bombyx mandarina]